MHETMKGVHKTMFQFTKKDAMIEEMDLTDEQLTEVTGGAGLVSSLLGSPSTSTTTSTGTTIQAGVQAAAGVGIQTDALNAVTGLL